ncbi:MAG: AI-2E family transporter [Verrucomicrobiales bacterium]
MKIAPGKVVMSSTSPKQPLNVSDESAGARLRAKLGLLPTPASSPLGAGGPVVGSGTEAEADPPNPMLALLLLLGFCATLYVARDIFLPLVLAGLFSFLLAPIVKGLERIHFPRVVAVITVTVFVFLLLGGLGYLIASQVTDLAGKLPNYKDNLVQKASSLMAHANNPNNPFSRASQTLKEVAAEAETVVASADQLQRGSAKTTASPVPVEVVRTQSPAVGTIAGALRPLAVPLGQAAVVIVLVIFILLGREDMRDRLIHLAGRGRLRLTTQALDDAGQRVSRYLLAETMVNLGYALVIGTGLYFIGMPNAILWGVVSGLMRFLPYVGPWLGAAGPLLLSLAVTDSWREPALTIGLFIAVELIGNNFIEPWAYGTSTGLAPLAIIIAALFWTWLWGPVGLVLATPLTVCVAVVAQHVPQLWFLHVLIGKRPPIATADRVYQRLLALDAEELFELIEKETAQRSLAEAFDSTVLAALRAEEDEFHSGLMPPEKREGVFEVLRPLIAKVGDAYQVQSTNAEPILCLPASDEADELAALMLRESLRSRSLSSEVTSSHKLIAEMVSQAAAQAPDVIVVSMVSSDALLAGVAVCHRLRMALPAAYIVAGAWLSSPEESAQIRPRLEKAGASVVCHTLERAVAAVSSVAA